MKKIIDFLFPKWKTVSSCGIEVTRESLISGRKTKEDAVLVVQESAGGRKRAYIIGSGGKKRSTSIW